jgi:hypothetical protein
MFWNFWKKSKVHAGTPVRSTPRAPVLFLDVDGVLHPHQRESLELLPLLETFLRHQPEIHVVISSTWRMQRSLEDLQELFSEDLRERVVGVTPFINRTPFSRYQEVQAYLDEYGPCRWCALDDEAKLFPPNCPNLVHTDGSQGVTLTHLSAVAQVLGLAG